MELYPIFQGLISFVGKSSNRKLISFLKNIILETTIYLIPLLHAAGKNKQPK